MQYASVSTCSIQFQVLVTCISYPSISSSSPPFSTALVRARKLLLTAPNVSLQWVCAVSASDANGSCRQPEEACVPMIQGDQQPLEITTWKPHMAIQKPSWEKSGKFMQGNCWQFAWLQPKVLIARRINFRKQTFSVFYQSANTQL